MDGLSPWVWCLAIEAMPTLTGDCSSTLDDDWAVATRDRSRAAHWENTVALTGDGVWVLTEPDGGAAELGDLFGPLAD